MRRVNTSISAFMLAAALLLAAGAADAQVQTRSVRRPFELSWGQSIDPDGKMILVISTAIDYRRLVFFRQPTGYVAEYRMYIEIRSRDNGARVRSEIAEKTVSVPKYEMTRSAGMLSEETRKVALEPGEYDIRATIEVARTSLKYEREARVTIQGREHGLFEMSDPVFSVPEDPGGSSPPRSGELSFNACSSDIPGGYRGLPGGVFVGFEGWIRMSWTVMSPMENRTGRGMEAVIRVRDSRKTVWAYTKRTFEVNSRGRGMFCVEMNVDELPLGFYDVTAVVSIPNSTRKVVREGSFTMLLGRAMFDEHFDDTLELLGFTAEDDDVERLRSVSPEERLDEWNRYWKSQDPTRTTDLNERLSEFLRRLRYTLENFGRHGPGWKTDMGRIYIRHGPPDNEVDRDGPTLGSRYRLWYYYSKGIVFIFEDPMGSGMYRLNDTRSL
jgi:GWxTD domain-containing protein